MSNHENTPQAVRVTLSPIEGRRLFASLSDLAEGGNPETGFSDLDELLDILDDANALAAWLRENVNLELEGPEAAKLAEMLEDMSPRDGFSQEADAVLPGIREKLETGRMPSRGGLCGKGKLTRIVDKNNRK
jgi:hypothetical protein